MKKTALFNVHTKLGAKMIPFAGYLMPVQYDGVNSEHDNVRKNIGVFDVSHMGEFFVDGEEATKFLDSVTSNSVAKLKIGQAQYSCFPNANGGIIDDLIIYRLGETKYMLVVNASNIEKDWNWLVKQNKYDVHLSNQSDNYSLLAIQGPKAAEAMQCLSTTDLSSIKYYHFATSDFAGIKNVIISATGYTGSGGFEIYCKNECVEQIWDKVMKAGNSFEIKPAGLAARDTLRLEMGYCLYGNDIDDNTSPIEAGLGWICKFDTPFIGAEKLQFLKEDGVEKKLIGFELLERGIPRKDYAILNTAEKIIGKVTSGTMSPTLSKGIGLGYVSNEYCFEGEIINIQIRKKIIPAKIVKLPFYNK